MREQIVEYLNRKIVGPDPDPEPSRSQGNGEEILFNDSPLVKYGAGVLYPQKTVNEEHLSEENERDESEALEDEDTSRETEGAASSSEEPEVETEANSEEDDGSGDDAIGLANAFKPSAMGISFMVEIGKTDVLRVEIKAGQYKTEKYNTEETAKNGRQKIKYLRRQITAVEYLTFENLTQDDKITTIKRDAKHGGEGIGLKLFVLSRSESAASTNDSEKRLITISLVNEKKYKGGRHKVEDCFFQTFFKITEANEKNVFIEYPENKGEKLGDEEKALRLLYQHKKTYAIGHGCAADWEEAEGDAGASSVSASVLPSYDVKPIIPKKFEDEDLKLSMLDFSSLKPENDPFPVLNSLCDKYEKWIEERGTEVLGLEESLQPIAEKHLENCRNCLRRMRSGIETLQTDERAMRAFRLMNEAILRQQLHYSLDLREWKKAGNELEIPPFQFPDPEKPMENKGSWYPFQLAFILMNINSINDPLHEDRKIADLIWFPTGGGKTEAYLGLTAFLLFLRRLKKPNNAGVTVLMRYTLRLLTTQQFQRAAALICACEYIRKENTKELGEERYSIGLWVGGSLTPNDRKDARSKLNKLSEGKTKENPFVVLRCPWCAAQMGATDDGSVKGYKSSSSPKTVKFVCGDKDCSFSSGRVSLPLYVIDEDIYEYKPSLIISTVDKFAMMPWKSETRSFFAKDGSDHTPPELIIQDELHLISGPLGSMVGHYETVIDEFCTDYSKENPVRPKIVASTATIRRAEEQVSALFNRKVFQFPPQALKAGDSFFAYEDTESDGRTYIGVHTPALYSNVTAQVRVFSALLQAVKSAKVFKESERDPYYTLIAYFNNLRELGHAATLIKANIPEYMKVFCKEPFVKPERRRYINWDLELTSRKSGNEITKALQDLERKYDDEKKAVDICLATNMISVGLDVSRLGLMTVVGQPKTTSEYIQTTSRVGRSKESPGLVVTIYNTGRPRDHSHYERFKTYHSTLYKQVEPTSVTPWTIPVRKRALHALVVAIVRILGSEKNSESPDPVPKEELRNTVYQIIEDRIAEIKNKDEVGKIKSEIKQFIKDWERFQPQKYGGFGKQMEEAPLMYPAGSFPNPVWNNRAAETLSSMRFVDRTCQVDTIKRYPNLED